jgi:hypothetical protein
MWLSEKNMENASRQETREFDRRRRRYKKTPFDREEKLKIRFDINDTMSLRERQEEQSRRKLFEHRWREEQMLKARQKKQSRNLNAAKRQETWRDVINEGRRMGGHQWRR